MMGEISMREDAKVSEEMLLTEEAKAYRDLHPKRRDSYGYKASPYNHVPSNQDPNTPCFVISRVWLRNWRKYIKLRNYDEIQKPTYKYSTWKNNQINGNYPQKPGKINEDIIIIVDEDLLVMENNKDIYDCLVKSKLNEKYDFKIIDKKHWNFFTERYPAHTIQRFNVKISTYYSRVDIFFMKIQIAILPSSDNWNKHQINHPKLTAFSKYQPLKEFKSRLIKVLNQPKYNLCLNFSNFRMWKLSSGYSFKEFLIWIEKKDSQLLQRPIPNANQGKDTEYNSGIEFIGNALDLPCFLAQSLEKCELSETDIIVIERTGVTGQFMFKYDKNTRIGKCEGCGYKTSLRIVCKCKHAYYCTENCRKKDEQYHLKTCSAVDEVMAQGGPEYSYQSKLGIAGLQNLGNTCFMAAGLQCLSNTLELSRYFLQDLYQADLNKTNKLGAKGKMANAYFRLIRDLWYGGSSVVNPFIFKKILGKAQQQFSGYQQQDAHELVTSILDCLHEDLNRVKYMLYVEREDIEDPSNNTYNLDCWNNHLKRNMSIIVDIFHGQFKSTVRCTKCNRFSVSFDPFNTISVPIYEDTRYTQNYIIIHEYDSGNILTNYACSLICEKGDTIADFREKVGEEHKMNPYSFIIGIVDDRYNILKLLCSEQRLSVIEGFKEFGSIRSPTLYLYIINPGEYYGEEQLGMDKREKEKRGGEKVGAKKESKGYNNNNGQMGYYTRSSYSKYGYSSYLRDFQKQSVIVETDDYNNGMSDKIIKVFCYMKRKSRVHSGKYENITIPIMLPLHKELTLEEVHHRVFRSVRKVFDANLADLEYGIGEDETNRTYYPNLPLIEAFEAVFQGCHADNWYTEMERNSNNLPYVLRIVNFQKYSCKFCNNHNCSNCPLPFLSDTTLADLLQYITEKDEIIDNSYYFRKPNKKVVLNTVEKAQESLFELELIWNNRFNQKILDISTITETIQHSSYIIDDQGVMKNTPTLENCIQQFGKPEKLEENNKWFCNKCNDHIRALKKMEIYKAPPILIIHLKRFRTNEHGISSAKMTTKIDCPLNGLDLSKFILSDNQISKKYNLYGVIHHSGTMGWGHYIAYAKSGHNQQWIEYDDSRTSIVHDLNKIISSNSYILFYRRQDFDFNTYEESKGKIEYLSPIFRQIADYTPEELAKILDLEAKEEKENGESCPTRGIMVNNTNINGFH